MLILAPAHIAAIAASRGSGIANLLTADPKEVWADAATGAAVITIDLGVVQPIDTVFLGHVTPPHPTSSWSIVGGVAAPGDVVLLNSSPLRAPDVAGQFAATTHAFWHGAPANIRHLQIAVNQPGGSPLTVGVVMVGAAFVPEHDKEWGSGRRAIDTGSATPLQSGGFAVVEGVRKRHYSWTLGDLSQSECDALEDIAMERGETMPVLVVEDPDRTAGLRSRIHYGLFERWRAFERRNRAQTRWELGVEEWA